MKFTQTASATLAFLLAGTLLHAEDTQKQIEPSAKAPVIRLSIFKNGLAAAMREIQPLPGDFVVDEKIMPVHGTVWFSPADGLSVRTAERTFEEGNWQPFSNLTESYLGQELELTFAEGENSRTVSGTVIRPTEEKPPKNWATDYHYGGKTPACRPIPNYEYLTLKLQDGQIFSLPSYQIRSITAKGINQKIPVVRNVLLFHQRTKIGGPLYMMYLTKGVSWAPSYRIRLMPDAKMSLTLATTITNELAGFKNVEVNLISGFPNIQFANVPSLLAGGTTLSQFFNGLGGCGQDAEAVPLMKQKAVMYNSVSSARMEASDAMGGFQIPESGTSEDIQYRSIGRLSMEEGETLYLTLDSAECEVERLVEWTIKDRRDVRGYYNYNDREKPADELWDSIRFKNPFSTAMTTAPVEIVDGEKILGQTTSYWTNPGQENLIKITKALTVIGKFTENEVDMKRPLVQYYGRNYRNPNVEGQFTLKNYRTQPAKVLVRLQFSGELISAEGTPKKELPETGVYSLNKRNELSWELTLKPQEEITMKYLYSVLVPN